MAPGTSSVLPRRWLQGRCHARSTRAALASALALATLWREAARVLPRAMASRSLPCSLGAGSSGLYAGASHPVTLANAIAAQGGGCKVAAVLARRGQRWLLRWREPSCGARRTCLGRRREPSCGARHQVCCLEVASRSLPCSLDAGSAGFYAGASHPVARGGACAA